MSNPLKKVGLNWWSVASHSWIDNRRLITAVSWNVKRKQCDSRIYANYRWFLILTAWSRLRTIKTSMDCSLILNNLTFWMIYTYKLIEPIQVSDNIPFPCCGWYRGAALKLILSLILGHRSFSFQLFSQTFPQITECTERMQKILSQNHSTHVELSQSTFMIHPKCQTFPSILHRHVRFCNDEPLSLNIDDYS
jgi:hypothetical protein